MRIIHISIDWRFSSPLDARADPRSLEGFFFTPVDFLSVSRHDARAPLERTKGVDFRRVQLSTEWCLKARNGSGGNVDDVDRSTSRRVGAWSIFWTSPEMLSAVSSVVFPFLCWWIWEMSSRLFTTEEVDSSPRLLLEQTTSPPPCRIWWVHLQSASQHFFGSVVLQSSFSLSCTYALGE